MIEFCVAARPWRSTAAVAKVQAKSKAGWMGQGLQVMVMLLVGMCHFHTGAQTVRDREIAQCLPGEIITWGDGQDRPAGKSPLVFVVDPSDAPPWFSEDQVLAAVHKSAQAWSACGVPALVQRLDRALALPDGAIMVQWSDKNSGGNFAQADLGRGLLAMSPSMFRLLQTRNPTHDARETLQMVISHEMGHHFGLMAHSRRCVDVTSYYDNGKGERCFTRDSSLPRPGVDYRATLPTACDIARCVLANRTKP